MTKNTLPIKNARLASFLRKALKPLFVACALAPLLGAGTASAQLYWDGPNTTPNNVLDGTSGNWTTSVPADTFWTPSNTDALATPHQVWVDGNTAVFQTAAVALPPYTISVGGAAGDAITAGGITFGTSGFDIAPGAGGGTLTIAGAGAVITVNPLVTGTISAQILSGANTDSMTITGGGTLILSGNNAQTYFGSSVDVTGNTTLQAGTGSAFPTVNFTVDTGSTVDLNGFSQSISSLADGAGGGGIVMNGTAATVNAVLTVGNAFNGAVGTTFSGQLTNTIGTAIETTNTPAPLGTLSLKVVAPANGYTLTLTGTNNNYTGKTTIGDATGNAAVLKAGVANTFSGSSVVDVQAGGTLDLNGFDQTIAALDGTGTGTVTNNGANVPATLTIGNAGLPNPTSLSSSANLKDGAFGGTLALIKNVAYTQVLAGNNTYSGNTTVTAGTLAAGSDTGFSPNSDYIVGTGGSSATLDINGFNPTIKSLSSAAGNVNGIVNLTTGNTLTIKNGNGGLGIFGGNIQGGGNLTLTGGNLVLAGQNIYSGRTTIAAPATLQAGSTNGLSPFSDFTVNGTLDLNNNNGTIKSLIGAATGVVKLTAGNTLSLTNGSGGFGAYAGMITGAGNLFLAGGVFIDSGTSNYTGVTLVSGSTYQAGSTTALSPNSLFNVAATGTVDLHGFSNSIGSLKGSGTVTNNGAQLAVLNTGGDNTTTSFTGSLQNGSAPLGLTKTGTGNFTVSNSTYTGPTTVSNGTLSAGAAAGFSAGSAYTVNTPGIIDVNGFSTNIGSLAGTGTGTNNGAAAAVLTTGLDGTDTTFSGILQDGASTLGLTKTGLGAMTLSGANTFSGGTMLQNGTLIVANSQALGKGNVTVNAGILQAGGATKDINVGGAYKQTAGELDLRIGGTGAGQFDRVVVVGAASLAGKLSLAAVNSYTPTVNDKLTIITAGGGVSGTFGQVQSNLTANSPLLQLIVSYLPNSVLLEFAQGTFAQAIAAAAAASAPGAPPLTAAQKAAQRVFLGLTPNQKATAEALDHLSSNSRAAKLLGFLDRLSINSIPAALDRIAPEEYGVIYEISRSAAKIQAATVENRLNDIHSTAVPLAPQGPAGPPDGKGSKEMLPPPEYRTGVFANGSGEFVFVGDTSNARGYDFDSGGVTVGVDHRFTDHFVAGLLFNYTRTQADLVDNGRINVNAIRGGAYASLFGGGAYVNGYVGGGYNDYDFRRQGLDASVHGESNGGEFNALIATGYDIHAGGLTAGPVASFQYTYTGLNSFDEHGSLAPLHIESADGESLRSNIGAHATYDIHLGGLVFSPELRATWQHEYGNTAHETTARLLLGSPDFTVNSAQTGRDSLLLNAGFTLRLTPQLSTYAFYDGELARTNYNAHNVIVGVRASF